MAEEVGESGSCVSEDPVKGVVSGTVESKRFDLPQNPEEPSVEVVDTLSVVTEVSNLIVFDRMNLAHRRAVKDKIRTALFGQSGEGCIDSRQIIEFLCDFMPRGVKKPEWSGLHLRHGICRDDKEVPDTETRISFVMKGIIKCRIDIEEDGIKMYVKRSSNFELYCG